MEAVQRRLRILSAAEAVRSFQQISRGIYDPQEVLGQNSSIWEMIEIIWGLSRSLAMTELSVNSFFSIYVTKGVWSMLLQVLLLNWLSEGSLMKMTWWWKPLRSLEIKNTFRILS